MVVAKGVGRQQAAAVMKMVSAVVMMRVPVVPRVAMVVVCRFNKKKNNLTNSEAYLLTTTR